MGRLQDLTGKVFGSWKVLEYAGNRKWICECQCELKTHKEVSTYSLTSGRSKSCRKCNLDTFEIGDIVNNWEIISNIDKDYRYLCKCHCGYCNNTIRKVRLYELKNGTSIGCGSGRNKDKLLDLSEKQFGLWKVLKYCNNQMWLCECQCKDKTLKRVSSYNLISGKSQSCGCSKKNSSKLIDIAGKTCGDLIVEEYFGGNKWICKCTKCGAKSLHFSHNIRRSSTLRCEECNSVVLTKEEILKEINEYKEKYNEYPYRYDLCTILNRGYTTINRYIDKYKLYEYIGSSYRSRYEKEIADLLKNNYNYVSNNRTILDGVELDLVDINIKKAIEFNGSYWHSTIYKDKYYHQNKTIACAKQGIHLIHIFEHEWVNDTIREKLKILLDNNSKNKVYGRDIIVREIDNEQSIKFLDEYHLQGGIRSRVCIGAYLGSQLIGVMTFGTPRFNNGYDYEIHRLCWKSDYEVVGGTEKLFSYFCKRYRPNSILTYVDISKFTGNVYTRLGFKSIQPNPITEPNYVWVSQDLKTVLSRYETQKHKLLAKGLGNIEQTEDEIMYRLRFLKIYDCGNLRLEWIANK